MHPFRANFYEFEPVMAENGSNCSNVSNDGLQKQNAS